MDEGKKSGGLTRRELALGLLTAAACASTMKPSPVKADLFGGDITVLLAQLEQQLALVSNAIATVQRVTETAQRAARMVDQGKQMLAMATGRGGLQGVLTGLKGIVDAGRGMTANLQYINIRGGAWKDSISANGLSFQEGVKLTTEAMAVDARFLGNMAKMSASFAQVIDSSSNGLTAAAEAVNDAAGVSGVVGQVQLLGREMVQLAGIAHATTQAMVMMGSMQSNELARQAAMRESERSAQRRMYGGFGRPQEAEPVDVQLTND